MYAVHWYGVGEVEYESDTLHYIRMTEIDIVFFCNNIVSEIYRNLVFVLV